MDRVVPLREHVPVAEVQGTLALDLLPRRDPPTLVPEQQQPEADVVPIDRRLRRQLDAWAGRFGQAAVEIVGGDRPASQLLRWASAEVYADLDRRARLVTRAGQHQPGQARVQPVRPKVVGVHTCFVTPSVVEASLRIRYGERSRALAARFELQDGRWVCTALEFA